jgi:hypothetical protein
VAFFRRRVRELGRLAVAYAALFVEMEELWLVTRIRTRDGQEPYARRVRRALERLDRPRSAAVRLLGRLRLTRPPSVEARRALTEYWTCAAGHLRRWRLWRLNPLTFGWNLLRDARQTAVFLSAMMGERF